MFNPSYFAKLKPKGIKNMVDSICNFIIYKLNKEQIIQEEKNEIYLYGLQLLMATLIKAVGLFVLAIIMGAVKESIIFMIFFSSLRIQAGGIHAHSLLKCFISTAIIMFSAIYIVRLFPYVQNLNIQIIMIVISIILVYMFAPVENENKPLSEEEKILYRKRSMITVLVGAIIILLNNSIPWIFQGYSTIASMALLLESMTLLPINKVKHMRY